MLVFFFIYLPYDVEIQENMLEVFRHNFFCLKMGGKVLEPEKSLYNTNRTIVKRIIGHSLNRITLNSFALFHLKQYLICKKTVKKFCSQLTHFLPSSSLHAYFPSNKDLVGEFLISDKRHIHDTVFCTINTLIYNTVLTHTHIRPHNPN